MIRSILLLDINLREKNGKSHREAIQASFHGAGHAIILTSILLILGFGVLVGSRFSSTYFFGVLTAVTLLGAIFADLLLPTCDDELREKKAS